MCNATITCNAKIAMCNATITCNAMLSDQIYFVACVSKWNVRNVKQCWSLVWSVPQLFHNISRTQPWDLPLYLASFAALLCIVTCQLSFLIGISCLFSCLFLYFLYFVMCQLYLPMAGKGRSGPFYGRLWEGQGRGTLPSVAACY